MLRLRVLIAVIAVAALGQLGFSIAKAEFFRASLPPAAANAFLGYVLIALSAGIACVTALLMTWRAGRRADARLLALFLALVALFWGSLLQFIEMGFTVSDGRQEISVAATVSSTVSTVVLGSWLLAATTFLNFSAVFPTDTGRPAWLTDRRIWLVPVALTALSAVYSVLDALRLAPDPTRLPGPLVKYFIAPVLLVLLVAWPIASVLFAFRLLLRNYRRATQFERWRALWVVAGCTAALALIVLIAALTSFDILPDDPAVITTVLVVLPSVALLIVVLSLAIAVFYAGTFDPSLVIRKTTIYGVSGVLLTGLFALVENVISGTLARWLHLPASVSTVAASMAVALAIGPLRKLLAPMDRGSKQPQKVIDAPASIAGPPPAGDA